jgi:hypothetical protein
VGLTLLASIRLGSKGLQGTNQGILTGGEESVSMVGLLVLTNSDQLLLIMNMFLFFFTKQAILMRRSIVLIPPLQYGFTERLNHRYISIYHVDRKSKVSKTTRGTFFS